MVFAVYRKKNTFSKKSNRLNSKLKSIVKIYIYKTLQTSVWHCVSIFILSLLYDVKISLTAVLTALFPLTNLQKRHIDNGVRSKEKKIERKLLLPEYTSVLSVSFMVNTENELSSISNHEKVRQKMGLWGAIVLRRSPSALSKDSLSLLKCVAEEGQNAQDAHNDVDWMLRHGMHKCSYYQCSDGVYRTPEIDTK